MWIKRNAKDLIRMEFFALRYVDWIDKAEKHHHRVFLDVLDVDGHGQAVAFAEFPTKEGAFHFERLCAQSMVHNTAVLSISNEAKPT